MSLTNASPEEAASAAQLASRTLAVLSASERNDALTSIHDALQASKDEILLANARDLEAAAVAVAEGRLSQSIAKRLDLGKPGKYDDMLQGILDVRILDDPLGKVDHRTLLDDDLLLERKSSPIGVLLIIFEARPEVIANIASLAIKSGNAAILKGGKESTESFKAIATVISSALEKTKVPNAAIQLVTTRDAIAPLLQLDQYIDLVIPRGGNELVRSVKNGTTIPVLGHADGLCSIYLRADCETQMAIDVVLDAKLGYTAACNSVETLLVDEDAFSTSFVSVAEALLAKGVELRCDDSSRAALAVLKTKYPSLIKPATAQDYRTEFLDAILAIKTIPASSSASTTGSSSSSSSTAAPIDQAIAHINAHSSHHTDAILTASPTAAEHFLAAVDSAGVFWNASTRLADGQRFGFGTEVGISTNKIHARGPVGLAGLTIYRWLVRGKGQVAAAYGAGGTRQWRHERLPAGEEEWVARDGEELELLRRHRAQKVIGGH